MTSPKSCAGGGLPEHWTAIEARKKQEMIIRKDERDKFLKRMLECISQYELLPNGMDFVIEDLLAELRQSERHK
jgi:hypothetical protein